MKLRSAARIVKWGRCRRLGRCMEWKRFSTNRCRMRNSWCSKGTRITKLFAWPAKTLSGWRRRSSAALLARAEQKPCSFPAEPLPMGGSLRHHEFVLWMTHGEHRAGRFTDDFLRDAAQEHVGD